MWWYWNLNKISVAWGCVYNFKVFNFQIGHWSNFKRKFPVCWNQTNHQFQRLEIRSVVKIRHWNWMSKSTLKCWVGIKGQLAYAKLGSTDKFEQKMSHFCWKTSLFVHPFCGALYYLLQCAKRAEFHFNTVSIEHVKRQKLN